jgi:hypothetical protein
MQAPHIAVNVFMRGLLKQLVTRIYFPDEPANAGDAVLALVPADRRSTLIAKKRDGKSGVLEWNVILLLLDHELLIGYGISVDADSATESDVAILIDGQRVDSVERSHPRQE